MQQRENLEQERDAEDDAFTHYVWRGHHRESSLREMAPEMVTTNGRTVRRMVADARGLVLQQFEDRDTSEAIVESVQSNCADAGGLVGYSMLSECEVLTIMSVHKGGESRWLASPGKPVEGRPRQMPTLPMRLSEVPTVRVTGRASPRWLGGALRMDVRLAQRVQPAARSDAPSPLDHVSTCQLWVMLDRSGKQRHVALTDQVSRQDFEEVSGGGELGAQLDVDEELFRSLGDNGAKRVWFLVSFDRRLMCLPNPWRQWWFPVEVTAEDGRVHDGIAEAPLS
ncbi:MAG: hypothetical protein ACOCV2_03820 [Persicimonas sp.]